MFFFLFWLSRFSNLIKITKKTTIFFGFFVLTMWILVFACFAAECLTEKYFNHFLPLWKIKLKLNFCMQSQWTEERKSHLNFNCMCVFLLLFQSLFGRAHYAHKKIQILLNTTSVCARACVCEWVYVQTWTDTYAQRQRDFIWLSNISSANAGACTCVFI